jgi:ribosome-associated protein
MRSAREGAAQGTPPNGFASFSARPNRLLKIVLDTLDAAKAEDVATIDLRGKTSIGDQMVVASGRSQRHVGAVADHLSKRLKEEGFGRVRVEGLPQCDWVLIDAGDVIVHIFRPEVREFYNLEKMWSADRPMERLVI